MAIVVAVWLMNFNSGLQRVRQTEPIAEAEAELERSEPGVTEIFTAGIKSVSEAVKNKFAEGRQFLINNTERNFVADGLEPIPKTNLP